MREKRLITFIVLILTVLAFSGCGIHVISSDGDEIVDVSPFGVRVDAGDTKVNVELGNINVDTQDNSVNIKTGDIKVGWAGESEEAERAYPAVYGEEIKKLDLDLEMGNVNIIKSNDGKVSYDYTVKVNGPSDEKCREIADSLVLSVKRDGSEIRFRDAVKDSGKNVSDWIRKNYDSFYSASFTVNVYVTDDIESIEADVDLGAVSADDISAKYYVSIDMGNFTGKGIAFTGDSKINTAMGNIEIDLSDIKSAKADLSVDMGNITVKAPDTPTVNCESDFTGYSGTATYQGGLVIEAETAMGDVKFK